MFVLSYVNVLCIYPKLFPPKGSELIWQTSMLSSYIGLIHVNGTICMVICLYTRFKSIILWPRITHLVSRLSQNASCGWGTWCCSLRFYSFVSFINRLRLLLLLLSRFSRVWLCNARDSSLPGSSIHGILQARVLEWVAIAFSVTDCQ